jgi:hypothetical protein
MKAIILIICIGFILSSILAQKNIRYGRGVHDKYRFRLQSMKNHLNEKSFEQLKGEALKMEAYINSKSKTPIFGGPHDYVDSLNKEELIENMTNIMLKNVELLNLSLYESIVASSQNLTFLNDEKPEKLGGLHDYIFSIDEDTLRKWSIAVDRYNYKNDGQQLIGAGIQDKIIFMRKIDFIEYLLKMIKNYPVLDSFETLNKLCVSYGITEEKKQEEPMFIGGLVNFIWKQSDNVLRQWALTCDKYDKEKRNVNLHGGLEDYVNNLSREQLMDICLKHARTYIELNSIETLNSLSTSYGFSLPSLSKKLEAKIMGGLEDFISKESVDVLRQWALTCERFKREQNNQVFLGGLVNYVRLLNKEQLIEVILNYAKEYPQLNSVEELNELAHKYGIVNSEKIIKEKLGGLDNYILSVSEVTLRQWALTCDKYNRTVRNEFLLGGLSDYIDSLTKEEIIKIILDYATTYPEISNSEKLSELSISYGFAPFKETQEITEPVTVDEGLKDFISKVRDDVLISWALTCDKYDRQTRKVKLLGGLVDYVRLLKREELIKIVMDFTKIYPELNSASKLQELAYSYGIIPPKL